MLYRKVRIAGQYREPAARIPLDARKRLGADKIERFVLGEEHHFTGRSQVRYEEKIGLIRVSRGSVGEGSVANR